MLIHYYRYLLSLVDPPNIKFRRPSWFHLPSPMLIFGAILFSYFLVTGGVIYDVIVEPPSIGSVNDQHGNQKPQAFLPYRINGQYIMEGLASSFLFTLGGLGFIILERSNEPNLQRLPRTMQTICGFAFILISYVAIYIFLTMKLPGYLK